MPTIKLIIFDLDGTLVDAYRAITLSFNFVMRSCGYPQRSASLIRRAVGYGDSNLIKPFVAKKDLGLAIALYRKHHARALIRYVRLFPHTRKLLEYLSSKGYLLAVASNRPTRFSQIILRTLKVKEYFAYVLCADMVKHPKPWPELLTRIMKKLCVTNRHTLYVGDMTLDAETGRRARVKTVIVATGSSTRKEIQGARPYLLIKDIYALSKIL